MSGRIPTSNIRRFIDDEADASEEEEEYTPTDDVQEGA